VRNAVLTAYRDDVRAGHLVHAVQEQLREVLAVGEAGRAVFRFCEWCQRQDVGLRELAPPTLSAYLHGLQVSPASVKLTASGLRHWLDFLTERGVLTHNPALSVRTTWLVVTEGKTPVLERDEAKALFASLEGDGLLELRDRAMSTRRRSRRRRSGGTPARSRHPAARRTPPTSAPWVPARPRATASRHPRRRLALLNAPQVSRSSATQLS
jgi:hypothetical protein